MSSDPSRVQLVMTAAMGLEPAANTYAASNTLALVVSVDRTLLDVGGPILGVWASTHTKP